MPAHADPGGQADNRWAPTSEASGSEAPRSEAPGGRPLRIALLTYRGNPTSGGQGVYVDHLSRALVALGHQVTVFSGQPYPCLHPSVGFESVPSLDLYRSPDPFRRPRWGEFRGPIDVAEWRHMHSGRFPEPATFSWRVARALWSRRDEFDLIHDNQGLGYGLLALVGRGWPVLATVHHPITVDRDLELSSAIGDPERQESIRRWYGFIGMQRRVLSRLPLLLTVSESSGRDLVAQMGARPQQLRVVAAGVDAERFRPLPHVARRRGLVMTTASADVALKGLVPLLEALAKVRTERDDAHLVVCGAPRPGGPLETTVERLGLADAVTVAGAVSTRRMVELYAEAEVAVVPSLYEGFSLPAVEAMSCGTALVATTGGALPEVTGPDGQAALTVPPGDPGALAMAILRLLEDAQLRHRLAKAGRDRVLERFTWSGTARGTAAVYEELLASPGRRRSGSRSDVYRC
ncbi:MAG: glycosyltransferase family 4 protein [Acidimicrobiales bacterium]